MSKSRQLPTAGSVSLPAAFRALQVGIVVHDPDSGAMVAANREFERLSGYSAAELRTLTVERISANTYSHTQAAAERRITAAAEGTPQSFEWRLKRADGELRWVSVDLSPITIDGRSLVVGEVTDITEYKHNDRRVRLFYRLLRHNLRNELNVIMGFAAQIDSVADVETAATAAGKIDTAANDLCRVAESVKQIESTITRQRAARRRRPASTVVSEVVDVFESAGAADYITVAERTEMWIAVDEAFDHALTHAVENAIVHADCPDPSVRIVVDESPNTGRAEIRIEDEGPPIPRMEIEALDEHSETTPTSHGSGVGLFVMKWCIESLGGELKIERRENDRGNVVSFYLPPKAPPAANS
ncbi:PAS domain-containing sensor histidine kinase [Halohasta salina]|uniref:PAS domain-containing sensor histidine kinase n=1 Tax=Halohasta salina TaxID=2961621 RepID=UPI0020A4AB23|nr:PAS domain-containing sensor histidine kinase [Halohasta salina]